jgi:hypothetical protein
MLFRPQSEKGRRIGHPALSPDGKHLALAELRDNRDNTQTLLVSDLESIR